MPQKNVLIFLKVPVPGLVKTNLTQNIYLLEKDATLIAEAMLKDIISLCSTSQADFFTPIIQLVLLMSLA